VDLYPAIDLRGGRCVRLRLGDFSAETVYDGDPVSVAQGYERAGARWIHVVDLDAARRGEAENLPVVAAVCAGVSCAVEASGGVRSVDAAAQLFDAGAARVVVGTAAVEEPALVDAVCARWPGRVALGLDVRGRELAVRGWERATGVDVLEALGRFAGAGVVAVIATQIERDGTMAGPDLDLYRALLGATTLDVIASGGVASLDDLRALRDLAVGGRRLTGAIVGRALYEGAFSAEEAIACLRPA
jgi:phosphoribosylformimino-5-aminoimidazole carboxamide ribotide isomerase